MKRKELIKSSIIFCIIICITVSFSACGKKTYIKNRYKDTALSICDDNVIMEDTDKILYEETISRVLQEPLWIERDIYDTGHSLMVPMHYSFKLKDDVYIKEFSYQFSSFMEYIKDNEDEFNSKNKLSNLHYLYLASWFSLLCSYKDREDLVPVGLNEFIEKYTVNFYNTFPGSWGGFNNIPEELDKILEGQGKINNGKSYNRAIVDSEMFTLAIMNNMYAISKITKIKTPNIEKLKEARDYAYKIFKSEVKFNEKGGFVFQPGALREHKDYWYAGYTEIDGEVEKKLVEDIGQDSSHFHRMPLFLQSFLVAQDNKENIEYFKGLVEGLKIQLLEVVLQEPTKEIPYYRLKNYMSGDNGYFRYGYNEKNKGYGPYELSRTFLMGWWAFLNKAEVTQIYEYTKDKFPLDDIGKDVYKDSVTVREQNPAYKSEEIEELWSTLASKLYK